MEDILCAPRPGIILQPSPRAACACSIWRNRDYETELAIWQDTVAKVPNNPRAHENLGAALERAHQLPKAIEQYEEALRITPDYAVVQNILGLALVENGRVRRESGTMRKHSGLCLILRRRTIIWRSRCSDWARNRRR